MELTYISCRRDRMDRIASNTIALLASSYFTWPRFGIIKLSVYKLLINF
jgi:hypothetical protein